MAVLFLALAFVMSLADGASAVITAASKLSWEFRITGGTSALSGRVEMRPNNTAPWGTICVDLFKESNYGPIAACNSAGFVGVTQAVYNSNFAVGTATSPIYLTNINCKSTDMFIQNCSTSELQEVGNCVHWEDVGVDCSPPTTMWQFGLINGTAPSNGILAIKPMPTLSWGSIYYWYFIVNDQLKHIELACAAVGYNLSLTKEGRGITKNSRYVFNRIKYTPTIATFYPYYYTTNCPTAATDIRQCSYYQFGSQTWDPYYYSIYLDCRPPEAAKVPTIEVRLTNPWPGWRSGVGNVEIRNPVDNAAWTNICPEAITTNSYDTPNWITPATKYTDNMKAICASAGFPGAKTPMFRKYGSSSATIYNSTLQTYDYYTDTMNCTGATLLSDCYIYAPAGNYYCGWTVYYAGIDCYSIPENRTEWEYRLWKGNNGRGNGITSGIFQMRPNTTAPWASVYQTTVVIAWDTICRTLGISVNSTSYLAGKPYGLRKDGSYYGSSGNTSYWIEVSSCSSADTTLFKDCTLNPLGSFSASYTGYDMAIDCNPPIYDPSQWEFRLAGSTITGSGRLEFKPLRGFDFGYIVEPYGIPIPSSSYTWYGFNAKAICHSLGFMDVDLPTIQSYPIGLNYSAPVYFQYMRCTATDKYVQNCTFSYRLTDVSSGYYSYAMGVECYPYVFKPMWRLVDGEADWTGRLQYKYEENGAWGTVCNDYFKNNYIAWNAACHSVGFLNVTGARYKSFGPGTGSIFWDDIQCKSGDFYIENCSRAAITINNCAHGQDVGVNCYPPADRTDLWEFRLSGGTSSTNGHLQMRPTSDSSWGMICSDPFNHSHYAWLAACRSVGFPNVQRAAWHYYGRGLDTIYLDNVQCFPNSTTLSNCTTDPIDSFFCTSWDSAGVDCDPPPETPNEWQFRLTGGRTTSNGRLEMRPTATAAWGSVCSHGLSHSRIALLAVCKTVGFKAVRPVPRFFGKGSGVIYLDNATCSLGSTYLNNCTFNPLYSHDCTHDLDFGIECFPTATVALTDTVSRSASLSPSPTSLLTLTKGKIVKKHTATHSAFSPTRTEIRSVSRVQEDRQSVTRTPTRLAPFSPTIAIRGNSRTTSNVIRRSSTVRNAVTPTTVLAHTVSPLSTASYAAPHANRSTSIDPAQTATPAHGDNGEGLSATHHSTSTLSPTIIPMPSCELDATATIDDSLYFSPMGSAYVEWPLPDNKVSTTLSVTLPNNFPLMDIADWVSATLAIHGDNDRLLTLRPTGVSISVRLDNATSKLTLRLAASVADQTFANLFPTAYADRTALVALNLSTVSNCFVPNIQQVVMARIVFTDPALLGNAPPSDGEPHVEDNHLVVPDPTFLSAPAEAAAVLKGLLPCDVKVLPSSMAYYRMLSPFTIDPNFFAVQLGAAVFLLFVLGMQVLSVLIARTFRVKRTLFGCAAACRAPAITIAVAQPLGLGVGYASASMIVHSEAQPENWVFGLAGCIIVAALPLPILLFVYRYISRRYVAYVGVAHDPLPSWLAPHVVPYGRMKPEMFTKTLSPLLNFRNVSPFWPVWTFLSPICTMLIIIVFAPIESMCEHVFLILTILHFVLAAIFAVFRPRRSNLMSGWTVLQLLITAIMFLGSALAVYDPESTSLADFSYVMCILQTAVVGIKIAISPVCFWSDRVFSYVKVKAVAEHIAPQGERFELNPGDADYQRDDEDARLENLDDDRISDIGEEPLLYHVGQAVPEVEEEVWAGAATKNLGIKHNGVHWESNAFGEEEGEEEEEDDDIQPVESLELDVEL